MQRRLKNVEAPLQLFGCHHVAALYQVAGSPAANAGAAVSHTTMALSMPPIASPSAVEWVGNPFTITTPGTLLIIADRFPVLSSAVENGPVRAVPSAVPPVPARHCAMVPAYNWWVSLKYRTRVDAPPTVVNINPPRPPYPPIARLKLSRFGIPTVEIPGNRRLHAIGPMGTDAATSTTPGNPATIWVRLPADS